MGEMSEGGSAVPFLSHPSLGFGDGVGGLGSTPHGLLGDWGAGEGGGTRARGFHSPSDIL